MHKFALQENDGHKFELEYIHYLNLDLYFSLSLKKLPYFCSVSQSHETDKKYS